jgi:hypothetical protein
MKQMKQKSCPKVAPFFSCVVCNYNTVKKSSIDKHLLTAKHILKQMKQQSCPKVAQNFICICGYNCNSRTTLWRHRKICDYDAEDVDDDIEINDELTDKEIIKALIKHTETLSKIVENGTNNTTTYSNNTNSLNKTFNLHFYLNETCKHAMNISDFVSSIKVNLEDLEHTGRQGYIQGITNIVAKNLDKLETHMRPLHCSDLKREVIYIKDNNEWTKETDNNPILTNAIKTIANKNIQQISKWKDNYPDCMKSDSNKNDLYLQIVSNSMNGLTKEEGDANIQKIISNVAKKVTIDKT